MHITEYRGDLLRIQRKRTKGWRMPANTRYVGRGTRWGNPFNATQIGVTFCHYGFPAPIMRLYSAPSLERCIDMYTAHVATALIYEDDFLEPLRGKNLCCWCPADRLCHADVLLRLANEWDR